jgi:hypothetical protein
MKEVRIGERNVTIPRFSAFKIVRSGRLIAKIAKAYPTIMFDVAKFERDYETANAVRITKTMAQLPRFVPLGLTDADFEGREYVEIPNSPNDWQRFASVFPEVMSVGEEDVVSLLALVLAPNKELEEEDESDSVDEYLRKKGKALLHEAEGDQLLDACIAVAEVLKEQFASKIDEAGNAIAAFTSNGNAATNGQNSQNSSTDSDGLTVGTEAESSIESSG